MCLKIVQRYSALVTEHFLGHVETDSANLSAARESLPRISSHVRYTAGCALLVCEDAGQGGSFHVQSLARSRLNAAC